jgi:murein DD-endopeptidase MepM/ murein hydrolase activator NlpD
MLLPATLASAQQLQPPAQQLSPTLARLEQIDAARVRLGQAIGTLTDQLEAVEAALAATEEQLAATTQQLDVAITQRARTEAALGARRAQFTSRIRDQYKRGEATLDYLAVLQLPDLGEASRSAKYVRAVLQRDRRDIDTYTALAAQLAAIEAQLQQLKVAQVAQRDALTRHRIAIAALVAEHRRLLAAADAESRRHALLLHQLERDPVAARQLTVALEDESRRIGGQLASDQSGNVARSDPPATSTAGASEGPREQPQPAAVQTEGASRGPGFLWPASGPVTSWFGFRIHPISGERRFHGGIDIGAPEGGRIRAVRSGVVRGAGPSGGYGNIVVIDHGRGLATLYAHQSRVLVASGQRVARGATIGYVGSTGYATGPHLHFEVRVNGEPRDPLGWL